LGAECGLKSLILSFPCFGGYWPENLRLATAKGDVEVVLFERSKLLERDWKEDSFCHTAFSTTEEDFDLALQKMKKWGCGSISGPSATEAGERFTFSISEGNYLQLGDRG
jgi:hypothetical protein